MTLIAWDGQLKFKTIIRFDQLIQLSVILISRGIALFGYFFLAPANRIGLMGNDGPKVS
jgi:uncharacterized protein (DUF486 family)